MKHIRKNPAEDQGLTYLLGGAAVLGLAYLVLKGDSGSTSAEPAPSPSTKAFLDDLQTQTALAVSDASDSKACLNGQTTEGQVIYTFAKGDTAPKSAQVSGAAISFPCLIPFFQRVRTSVAAPKDITTSVPFQNVPPSEDAGGITIAQNADTALRARPF